MAIQSMILEPPLVKEVRTYAGLLANIPSGWVLCDGQNGVPDLRDRFIKGAPAGNNPGGTGGSNIHTHSDHPELSHSGGAVGDIAASSDVFVKGGTTASVKAAADTHTHPAPSFTQPNSHPVLTHTQADNIPIYYELAFITKPEWWP